jgi:hypothetical protein
MRMMMTIGLRPSRIVIQICECAICKQWSAVFQIVLVQWSSLVQLFVVKHENSSREQITSHIITYHFYVAFHKLFVGGLSQHIRRGFILDHATTFSFSSCTQKNSLVLGTMDTSSSKP